MSLHFVSVHNLHRQKVWGGLHPLSSFPCLFASSLELTKAESQPPSKLSLPWCVTSITEAERLWVKINTTLNLYTLLSNSIYLLSTTVFSVSIQWWFHLDKRLSTHSSITLLSLCCLFLYITCTDNHLLWQMSNLFALYFYNMSLLFG